METVWYLLGAVVFFALIMVSIALHEVGHLIPAKLFGVKVTEYFVGFGRTLWKRRIGSTDYGVKALPLGGYVRLVGMYPPAPGDNHVRASGTNALQQIAEDARAYEWEEITPEDDGKLLFQKPVWQRIVIMSGGVAMNLLLAFLLLLGVTAGAGVARPTLAVASVPECVIPANRADRHCGPGDPKTPAYEMGLKPGDVLVSFNGQRLQDWDQVSGLIRANLSAPATLVVQRDGQQVPLPTVPTVTTGVPSRLDPGRNIEAGFLGVTPKVEVQRGGPVAVGKDMWTMSKQSAYALLRFPVKVWRTGVDMVTGRPRDVYGPVSVVGASRVAGEIVTTNLLTSGSKVAVVAQLLGSVNLFLALFNIVPLPPLDGGHVAGAIWDGVRRTIARLRRRAMPPPFDTAKLLPISWAVTALFIVSGAVLIIADLINPIRLF
ncbi:RIP metalloprotease RseP [Raineyella antarctica]|uniref:RIP metalloprotease RseP n=1 Tax=Raineyella antarctica TaxID=1577474 RepID=A0A1G6HAK4_9ACTN|nr:site-2 protease family protein [Raineyella antarctica]SDB91174.1 RIP metalloprotease RseP [Raineyella antarctica]